MLIDAFASVVADRVKVLGLSQSALAERLHDWPAAKIRVLLAGTIRAAEVSLPQAVTLGDALGMSLDELAEAAGFYAPKAAARDV